MSLDTPSDCTACGLLDQWLLHPVYLRNCFRRLCTSCVLKLHSGSFCPICFEVYTDGKLPGNRVLCSRCPSVIHLDCVRDVLSSSYVCPPCGNPNFIFFDSSVKRCFDVEMATVLVAAAEIACVSISKAASVSKAEAERKGREAAVRKREAKEAVKRFEERAERQEMVDRGKRKGKGKGKGKEKVDEAAMDPVPISVFLVPEQRRKSGKELMFEYQNQYYADGLYIGPAKKPRSGPSTDGHRSSERHTDQGLRLGSSNKTG